ncbi:hypothetical protein [Pseudomonas wuhanensis]|uniref:Uncharacterized protein n=1 Tax=Pseudomonas wuhanensis TaxID=2954098 RepID=A0ABY9GY20_9PSED|nr:hypothetical protein [Pseudomonas sp. FP607]WLI20518.1 hypothetical protein PSH88_10965 [Pseudomonas sp. FP607]
MTGLDARLTKRYDELVMGHSNGLPALAAGMKALPRSDKAFAQTQALWRFLSNDRVRPVDLVKPLLARPTRVVGMTVMITRWSCTIGLGSITCTTTARLIACK